MYYTTEEEKNEVSLPIELVSMALNYYMLHAIKITDSRTGKQKQIC